MSYNVEQITAAVISDGNGDICGYSYKERQKLLRYPATSCALCFMNIANEVSRYINRLRQLEGEMFNPEAVELLQAAAELIKYYENERKENGKQA